jgi:hypothetical protein
VTSPLQTATLAASLLIGAPLAMAGAAAPEIDPVLRIETAGRAARYLRAIELIETTDLWDSSETTIELGTDTLTRIVKKQRRFFAPTTGYMPVHL